MCRRRAIAGLVGAGTFLVLLGAMCAATDGLSIWINSSGNPNEVSSCLVDGSPVYIYVRVPERITQLVIWDLPPSGDEVIPLVTGVPSGLSPGDAVLAFRGWVTGRGSETLLLQVTTQSGVTLSASCTFEIRDDCEEYAGEMMLCMMADTTFEPPPFPDGPTGAWTLGLGVGAAGEGCNVSYHVGQRIDIRYEVYGSDPTKVSLRSIPQRVDSQMIQLDSRTVSPRTVVAVPITIGSGQGMATLLLRADSGDEGWESCMCKLWVRSAADFSEGFESGRLDGVSWVTGTSDFGPWDVAAGDAHSGRLAATSGGLDHAAASSLSYAFSTDRSGVLSFWYHVSTERGYDELRFYVGDVLMDSWSGDTGWRRASYPLNAGSHHLCWIYRKDDSVSDGEDRVSIDDVAFVSN